MPNWANDVHRVCRPKRFNVQPPLLTNISPTLTVLIKRELIMITMHFFLYSSTFLKHVMMTIFCTGPVDNCYIMPELGTRSFLPGLLSPQFFPMDQYCSITHFPDFQVCSSLNHSKKQWFALV